MRGPLRWLELREQDDWADASSELSVAEATGSDGTGLGMELGSPLGEPTVLGTGLGTGLGEPPRLGTGIGIGLGESPRLGAGLGTGLGESPRLGDSPGEPTLLGDRDRGKRCRRLRFLRLVTGSVGRSRNRQSRTCFR